MTTTPLNAGATASHDAASAARTDEALPLAARVLLSMAHESLIHRVDVVRQGERAGRRAVDIFRRVPGAITVMVPAVRMLAGAAERHLPIEAICAKSAGLTRQLFPEACSKLLELLEGASARSETLCLAACVPLLRAAGRASGDLGLEIVMSLGRGADVAKRTIHVIERETLVTRITEELVLPTLVTVEALAEVGACRQLPARRLTTLGMADDRLKRRGLSESFLSRDFHVIRNASAHHTAKLNAQTGVISFAQTDGTVREIPARDVATLLMCQPMAVSILSLVAGEFVLRRWFGLDGEASVAELIRAVLRSAKAGRFEEIRRHIQSRIDTVVAQLRERDGEDIVLAQTFLARWMK